MTSPNDMTVEEMKDKLIKLYLKVSQIEESIQKLIILREQTIDDIEMAETLIMHQFNRRDRIQEFNQP